MKRVLLGMSGGTDSSVSAAVLKELGYAVTGCYLLLSGNASPSSPEALAAAEAAERLKADFFTLDCRNEFRDKVEKKFISEYLAGRTPNPCIECNPNVKIKALAEAAERLGIEKIATGHYALSCFSEKYNSAVLKASPSKKDQSYFLCRLSPEQTEKIIFPLGSFLSKEQVRLYGERLSVPNFSKPDSQEICFIPSGDYASYIRSHSDFVPSEGNIIDNEGNIIGRHSGIINYTVGQRKGLGSFGKPMYVKEINAGDNTVRLCTKEERSVKHIRVYDISFSGAFLPQGKSEAFVKIRSTARPQRAEVSLCGDTAQVDFYESVGAPTPGQTAAFYDEEGIVLAGGTIL